MIWPLFIYSRYRNSVQKIFYFDKRLRRKTRFILKKTICDSVATINLIFIFSRYSEGSVELSNLVEDKEIAARAVAFVVNGSRKGIVPLCADVANLLRAKRRYIVHQSGTHYMLEKEMFDCPLIKSEYTIQYFLTT